MDAASCHNWSQGNIPLLDLRKLMKGIDLENVVTLKQRIRSLMTCFAPIGEHKIIALLISVSFGEISLAW